MGEKHASADLGQLAAGWRNEAFYRPVTRRNSGKPARDHAPNAGRTRMAFASVNGHISVPKAESWDVTLTKGFP